MSHSTNSTDRVWFVTGASGGLGRGLFDAVIAGGERIVATVRNQEAVDELTLAGSGRALVLEADVTNPVAIRDAVASALTAFGRIDVLVNNAGYTLLAGVEEATDDDIRQQFETNVFGSIDVTRAVLPVLREQRCGFILMISSVAGVSAAPGFAYYAASKHAVEGFSESLSKEVGPLGIKVTIIEPGSFRTNALGSSMSVAEVNHDYDDSVGKFRATIARLAGSQAGDPRRFGEMLMRLVGEDEPPLRLAVDPGATPAIRPKLESQLREIDQWSARMATVPIDTAS